MIRSLYKLLCLACVLHAAAGQTATMTETFTVSLPTASSTVSLSESISLTETFSVSLSDTFSESLSSSFSLTFSESVSQSETFTTTLSLPTSTDTVSTTMTMPTGTQTYSASISLPTATDSKSATFTDTVSLSLPTATTTQTFTVSLPTGTETLSLTLSLPTSTASLTFSHSLTFTFSLPTGTDTTSISLSLPTASLSLTATFSLSATFSLTSTFSLSLTFTDTHSQSDSLTQTFTLTETMTVPSHSNYSTGIGPVSFVEGQDVRISLLATLGETELRHFNTTGGFGHLQLQIWEYSSAYDYDCTKYTAQTGTTPFFMTKQFGMSLADQDIYNRWVSSAFITFTAPHNSFKWVICFKHSPIQVDGWTESIRFDFTDKWLLFTREGFIYDTAPVMEKHQYMFQSEGSKTWYYTPEATPGQYVVMQINSVDMSWNFSRPSSSCSSSSTAACAYGDNLKLVPAGVPCTFENHHFDGDPYYGSLFTDIDGSWQPSGLPSLLLGATAGGIGLFGTDTEHPLIEATALASAAVVESIPQPSYLDAVQSRKRSYVYVRLPRDMGSYDVCFSAKEVRAQLRDHNLTVSNIPMWTKLYPCGAPNCISATSSTSPSLNLVAEQLGWTMLDLSPGTYGTVRIDSGSGNNGLNRAPVLTKNEVVDKRQYFMVNGGDQLRIVPTTYFSETFTQRGNPNVHRPLGSSPSLGCWYRDNDRYWDEGSDMPSAIRDFQADPTNATRTDDDATNVHEVYGTLYMPGQGDWMVCYRKGGASGWRVLPWHYSLHSVPLKWRHIESQYTPYFTWSQPTDWGPNSLLTATATVQVGTPLVAGYYGSTEQQAAYPPDVQYYMNDTRQGTWGPLTVTNGTGTAGLLSAMPWNLQRNYSATDSVIQTIGSTVRLVHPAKSCDYPFFAEDEGAENKDGGAQECNNLHSTAECLGSTLDSNSRSSVVYYLTVPSCTNPSEPSGSSSGACVAPNLCNLCNGDSSQCMCLWRVCWRHGGYNWKVLEPQNLVLDRSDGTWGSITVRHNIIGTDSVTKTWTLDASAPGYLSKYYQYNTASMLLKVSSYPSLSLFYLETRGGMEAGFLISDSNSELSVAHRGTCNLKEPMGMYCERSGDVFRLVESGSNCDITPTKWGLGESKYADLHLSLYCPNAGSGSTATTGLVVSPCTSDRTAQDLFCAGSSCAVSSDTQQLQYLYNTRTSPQFAGVLSVYDDVVPYDSVYWNTGNVFASIVLPPFKNDAVRYKQCYKQAGSLNWIVFNTSWEIEEPPSLQVLPDTSLQLLGGELQKLSLKGPEVYFLSIALFQAKFVPSSGTENDGCMNPPGGSEGTSFGSVTSKYTVTGTDLSFYLPVPQKEGKYWLCIRLESSSEDTLSWFKWGRYSVLDSGVRWFVTEGNLPANQGTSVVSLVRCKWDGATCNPAQAAEVFNTDQNADAAKIVPWSHACHDGSNEQVLNFGDSIHVGRESPVVNGVTDLGPADGLADIAEFHATLPISANDAPLMYKICVMTSFGVVGRSGWVEVQEASSITGQVLNTISGTNKRFTTNPGKVKEWVIADNILSQNTLGKSGVVSISGASTKYVYGMQSGSPVVTSGLNLTIYSGTDISTSTHVFKLVKVKSFSARTPPSPGTGLGWNTVDITASCLSAGVEEATTNSGCTDPNLFDDVTCPQITLADGTLQVDITLPISSGYYIVCYRATLSTESSPSQPWINLFDPSGNPGLWVVPSYLEYDSNGASEITPGLDTLVLYDVRSIGGSSLSSWCGTLNRGVVCTAENQPAELQSDWVAIINASMNCPVVATPSSSTWEGGKFYQVTRVSNETAQSTGGLRLPPSLASLSGRYKICILKSGDWTVMLNGNAARHDITQRGISYQAWNRESPVKGTLGGTAYFQPSQAGTIDSLGAIPLLPYNSTLQFMVFDGNTIDTYKAVDRSLLPEVSPGSPSHTPIIKSGEYVDVIVQAESKGAPVPFSSDAIEVLLCQGAAIWNDLDCSVSAAASRDGHVLATQVPFHVINTKAVCTHGPEYGWPAAGLKQFLTEGAALLRLQLRSACPVGTFDLNAGCGFKIVTTGTNPLASPPIWVNVYKYYPDAIAVDMDATGAPQRLDTGVLGTKLSPTCTGPPTCYVKRCRTHHTCTLLVMALYGGPREFSARGTLKALYATADYGAVDTALSELQQYFSGGVTQFLDKDWSMTGDYNVTFTPKLRPGVTDGYVFFNISYGDPQAPLWTRVVVHVQRPRPTRLLIHEVVPLDTGSIGIHTTNHKEPVPMWHPESVPSLNYFVNPSNLVAQKGSYLEALIPYELVYHVEGDFNGETVMLQGSNGKNDLDGWTLTPSVKGVPDNAIMEVEYDPKCSLLAVPACIPDVNSVVHRTANLLTSLTFSVPFGTAAPTSAQRYHPAESDGWAARFRVQSNKGCSKLSGTAPGGVGCHISFKLTDGTHVVEASIVTPVRVVGNTIRVYPAKTASPVYEGVEVGLVPGILNDRFESSEFLVDEFHYGDIFALIGSPLPLMNGIANRDGVRADASTGDQPVYYTPSVVDIRNVGVTWGTVITIRTSKPCIQCEFTFHSTWGAGPTSSRVNDGSIVLSLTDPTDGVYCTPDLLPSTVTYATKSTLTRTFNITVTAGIVSDTQMVPTLWPKWWVFLDTEQGVTLPGESSPTTKVFLRSNLYGGRVFTVRMTNGVAVFDELFLVLNDVTYPSQVEFAFTTIGTHYSATAPGSVKEKTLTYGCKARVLLEEFNILPVKVLEIKGEGQGITPLCAVTKNCTHWESDVAESATFTAQVFDYENGAFAVNTKHGGGVTVRINGVAATWECGTSTCETAPLSMRSAFTDIRYNGFDSYLYGTTDVVFEKGLTTPANGNLVVTLKSFTAPIRGLTFEMCLTKTANGQQVIDTSVGCISLSLNAKVRQPTYEVGIVTHNLGTNIIAPGSPVCNTAPASEVAVVTYYPYKNQKYIAYDISVQYTLKSQFAQIFVDSNDTLLKGPSIVQNTALQPPYDALRYNTHNAEPITWFRFYGRDPTQALQFTFEATDNDNNINIITTTLVTWYTYSYNAETYSSVEVLDEPNYADECIGELQMPVVINGYRSYRPHPGKGWSYAAIGGVVGVPIPIQVRVLNGDGNRALSYPSTDVVLTKEGATACNDGGTLTLYGLKPPSSATDAWLLDGTIDQSFVALPTGKATQYGQATLWPSFSQPCESCTVEVSLCYSSASSSADPAACLMNPSASETQPILAERKKVSKPFTIRFPRETGIYVTGQTLITNDVVGSLQTVYYDTIQEHAGWATVVPLEARGTTTVWAFTVAKPSQQWDTSYKYGNGGFLISGQAGARCGITAAEFESSALNRWGAVTTLGTLRFYFTRPCLACEVWLRYRVEPLTGGAAYGVLLLRDIHVDTHGVPSPGMPVVFNVKTCGSAWIAAGVPLQSVKKRRHFSVTVMRVDGNFVASYSGDVSTQVLPLLGATPMNGGGGKLLQTSPLVQDEPPTFNVYSGSGTVRMMYTRACYECGFSIGGRDITVAVLTDPTQIIVNPAQATQLTQLQTDLSASIFAFEAYAADELGDRSYTVGGPTLLKWKQRYQQGAVTGMSLGLGLPPSQSYTVVDHLSRSVLVLTSKPSVDTLHIAGGLTMYDGVPFGSLSPNPLDSAGPGVLQISISEPIVDMEVSFVLGSMSLPTKTMGSKLPPYITNTVVADRFFVLEDTKTPKVVVAGDVLNIRLVVAGPLPGAPPEELVYFVSHHSPGHTGHGHAQCASTCANCVVLLSTNTTAEQKPFKNGFITFEVLVQKGGGDPTKAASCDIVFGSSISSNTYTLTLAISERASGSWAWHSTPTLSVTGGPTDGTVTSSAAASHTHTVSLKLWDKNYTPQSEYLQGTALNENSIVLTVNPMGCFLPTAGPTINAANNFITWEGVFVQQTSGRCAFESVSGLGVGVILTQFLNVEVQTPVAMQIVPTIGGNITQTAMTSEGIHAGTTGDPNRITIHIVDAAGDVVTGDWGTRVDLRGGNGMVNKDFSGVAMAGIVEIDVIMSLGTRKASGHVPWWFEANGGYSETQLPVIKDIGPLYIVIKAVAVKVFFSPPAQPSLQQPISITYRDCNHPGETCEGGITAMKQRTAAFIPGYNFDLSISVEDRYGTAPTHEEDIGHNVHFRIRSMGVPCLSADLSRVQSDSCQAGGRCVLSPLEACLADRWALNGEGTTVVPFPPASHQTLIGGVRYLGPLQGRVPFLITSYGFDDFTAGESLWLAEVIMQRPDVLVMHNATCNPLCTLPVAYFPNVDHLRSQPEALTMQGIPRTPPLTPFSLTLLIVDKDRVPLKGDNTSVVVLTASCTGQASYGVGRLTGFANDQFLEEEVKGVVSEGTVTIQDVVLPSDCKEATLEARVKPVDPMRDTLGVYNVDKLVMKSIAFEVKLNFETPAPPPTPVPVTPVRKFPTAVFQLGKAVDLQTFNRALFEESVKNDLQGAADNVVLEVLCNIPEARAKAVPPITDLDRANKKVCRRYAMAAGRSADMLQGTVVVAESCPCAPLAEFRVEISNPTDANAIDGITTALLALPTSGNSSTAAAFDLPPDAATVLAPPTSPPVLPTPYPSTSSPFVTDTPNTTTPVPFTAPAAGAAPIDAGSPPPLYDLYLISLLCLVVLV